MNTSTTYGGWEVTASLRYRKPRDGETAPVLQQGWKKLGEQPVDWIWLDVEMEGNSVDALFAQIPAAIEEQLEWRKKNLWGKQI